MIAATAAAPTVRDALDAYFSASGFDAGSWTDEWVAFRVGPLPVRFPNTAARKAVVPIHDVHHAVTGYRADMAGEAEIAAFELGGGMGEHWVGWYLNLLALSSGWLPHPRRTLRALARGRRARNFYVGLPFDRAVLDAPLDEVRARMDLASAPRVTAGDVASFAGWTALATGVGLVSLVTTLPVMLVLGVVGGLRGQR